MDPDGLFHVVCHDCRTEELVECPDAAADLVADHDGDHRTTYERIV